MKSKKNLVIVAIVIAICLFGITYAFFQYYGIGANQTLTAGAVNLILNEGKDTIDITNIFPETKEKARSRDDNFITFTVSGVNTTEDEDIYYEILLNEGKSETGMTRFNPEDLVFDLIELNTDGTDGEYLVDAMSFSDINAKRIWVDTVDRNTATKVNKTYKLRMWLSEDVLISDTDPTANYPSTGYENHYASVKVSVYGDFVEKELPVLLSDRIEEAISLTEADVDGTRFVYGKVDNNYVWYSGKLWRIVAVNSDGSIKLVTQGNMTTIAWDTSSTNTDYSTSQIRTWLNNEFLPTLHDADNLLVDYEWDYTTYADFPTQKATENIMKLTGENAEKVGLLNIYEFMMTGGNTSSSTSKTFLNNGYYWWTMSPRTSGSLVWHADYNGSANSHGPTNCYGARPSVNLKSGITILGGTGEKNNPYTIDGDKQVGITSELLLNRVSGEYINFNNTKYRIVGIENDLTKITMADYDVKKNTLSTTGAFGASTSELIFSTAYGIGKYLNDWYNATNESDTSGTYTGLYLDETYKSMIATPDNGVRWYAGPDSGGTGSDYTKATQGTGIEATIGLGRYGEMFSSQFGTGYSSSTTTWLMTKYSGSSVWSVTSNGSAYYFSPTYNYGARPSFYLKSDVKITGGTGQPGSPYEIVQ